MKHFIRLVLAGWLALPLSAGMPEGLQEPTPPDVREQRLEQRIFDLVNEERIREGLPALEWDERLAQVARGHSRDMAERDYIGHVSPEGGNPTQRGERAGYVCRTVVGPYIYIGLGENIYQNNLYSRAIFRGVHVVYEWNTEEEIARDSVKGWMSSAGHRQNILKSTFERSGVGVAFSEDHKVLITQNFC